MKMARRPGTAVFADSRGLGMADFLLGKMSDFQQTNATPDDLRTWVMSYYAQDSFKINNNFTINFGAPLGADILGPG